MNKTLKKVPLSCPSCEAPLQVTRLECEACGTEVTGRYELPPLARLPQKDQQFILTFVRSSGSLKEMAKQLGLSYPTVRNLLDEVIDKLKKTEPA